LVYDNNTNRNAVVVKLDATQCHCCGEEEINMWKIINQDSTTLVAYEDELEVLSASR